MQLERFFERLDKLAQSRQVDVLRRRLIKALPDFVVHVEVVLSEALLHVLRCLNANADDPNPQYYHLVYV